MQQDHIINPINAEKVNLMYDFINFTESVKFQCKILHWNSRVNSEHQLLDALYFDLIKYQDDIIEDYLGINPGEIKSISIKLQSSDNPKELIKIILDYLLNNFYPSIQSDKDYKGIISLIDEFIHKLHKYSYLLELV